MKWIEQDLKINKRTVILSDPAFFTGCLCSQQNNTHDTVPAQPWTLAMAVRSWSTVESHALIMLHIKMSKNLVCFFVVVLFHFCTREKSRQLWGFYNTKFFVNSVDIWQMNYQLPHGSKISISEKNAMISQCLLL